MTQQELCRLAVQTRERAYAPYSGCAVGAALLAESGQVYTGCNIENAAFTPTVCAERTALFKAVSEGERHFSMLAVAGGKMGESPSSFPPCGVCRQVLAEFCPPDFPVLLVQGDGSYTTVHLGDLLPMAFTPTCVE